MAVCLAVSAVAHGIGAVGLSALSMAPVSTEPVRVSIDAGARPVRVTLSRPQESAERVLERMDGRNGMSSDGVEMPPVEKWRAAEHVRDPLTISVPAARLAAVRASRTRVDAFGLEALTSSAVEGERRLTAGPPAPPQRTGIKTPDEIDERAAARASGAASRAEEGASTSAEVAGELSPRYPAMSRRLGESGLVVLEVRVLTDGSAGAVRVVRDPGHRRLVEAAIEAVRAVAFSPATRGGEAVESWLETPVRFVLD